MERVNDGDREREDGNHEEENKDHERENKGHEGQIQTNRTFFVRDQKIDRLETKMLRERLINALFDYTSLPKEENELLPREENGLLLRERNGLCISSKEIKSEYDEIKLAKDRDREREDRDREREDGVHERQKMSDDIIYRREKCIMEACIRI